MCIYRYKLSRYMCITFLAEAVKYLHSAHGNLQAGLTNYLNAPKHNSTGNKASSSFSSTDKPSCSYTSGSKPSPSYINNVTRVTSCSTDTCSACSSNANDIPNNYCTLSMLIQLRTLLLNRSNCSSMKPLKKETKIVAGDGVFHIEKLLSKCASYSETNASIIKMLCPDILPQNIDVTMVDVSNTLDVQEKAKKERFVNYLVTNHFFHFTLICGPGN